MPSIPSDREKESCPMSVIETLKSIAKTAEKVKENSVRIEMQQLVIELQNGVLSSQEEIRAKQERIDELEAQFRKNKDKSKLIETLELKGNAYWPKIDPGKVPFCVACVHDKGQLNPLLQVATTTTKGSCSVCKDIRNDVFTADPGRISFG